MEPLSIIRISCPECGTINRLPRERSGDRPICGRCRNPLFSSNPVELSDSTFDAVISGTDIPVLVDFWAPWCGPCRAMAPIFRQAAGKLEPSIRLGKLNTEQFPAIASRFGIRSIPTLALFSGGRELDRVAGALDLGTLLRWVRGNTA